MKSISIDLHQKSVDPQELFEVMKSFFNYHSNIRGSLYTFTLIENGKDGLVVKFNAVNRKIESILQVGTIPSTLILDLKAKIHNELMRKQEKKIGQSICFSRGKIDGTFRYNELFQIVSAPINASQPPEGLINAKYPFILQFEYVSSSNIDVDGIRRSEEGLKYIRILNALLQCKISERSRFVEMFWTEDRQTSSAESCFKYVSSNYYINGLERCVNSFDIPEQKIPTMPFQIYYNHSKKNKDNDRLYFPDNLKQSLDLYFSLNSKQQERFYIAACWLESAEKIGTRSQSSSFIAYVSALESLINNLEKCTECSSPITISLEQCSKCDGRKFNIGKSFKDLLESNGIGNVFTQEKNVLYSVRSSLVHGSNLFSRDKYGHTMTMGASCDWLLHSN